jgi:L-ascorbate metabolism protein UlaG (beta-lactamase superfamily)
MQTSWTPRFLISVKTLSQNFAPSPIAGPQPEDVTLAVHGHADHDIDRLVRASRTLTTIASMKITG